MNPEMIGLNINNIVLGKHSGRHAIKDRLIELGYNLSDEEIDKAFVKFKALSDKKKEIKDEDLSAIVENEVLTVPETYKLDYLQISSGTNMIPTATVRLTSGDENIEEAACGDGPVDAIYKVIEKITGINSTLQLYNLHAVTEGKDALGEVTVKIQPTGAKKTFLGRGVSTDVLEASAKAYLNAVNKIVFSRTEDIDSGDRPKVGI
jgi:2-isopropylmalate synthase